ncbi:hypothetical protein AtDm6_0811 [Acetobacter tropicalis]|uniref:Uncharacterized protein n=1 Tax=Acetobacter tropicalis TaxID=104102 RepID=A0A094YSX7_9PROT|nr:hypothetical protein AtDm6_0811 [Acetobacter tropicalis]
MGYLVGTQCQTLWGCAIGTRLLDHGLRRAGNAGDQSKA